MFPADQQKRDEQHVVQSMSQCDHCGAHVSERFARVFANERGQLLACPSCSANAGIAEASRERSGDT